MDVIYIYCDDLEGIPFEETKEGILEWHPVEEFSIIYQWQKEIGRISNLLFLAKEFNTEHLFTQLILN